MKPICDACGTPNPLDSKFCLECGVLLIIDDKKSLNINKLIECDHDFIVGNYKCKCRACIKCQVIENPCYDHKPETLIRLQNNKTFGINAVFDDDKSQFANDQIMKMMTSTMERIEYLELQSANNGKTKPQFNDTPKDMEFDIKSELQYEKDHREWVREGRSLPNFLPEHMISKQKSKIARSDVKKSINSKSQKPEPFPAAKLTNRWGVSGESATSKIDKHLRRKSTPYYKFNNSESLIISFLSISIMIAFFINVIFF